MTNTTVPAFDGITVAPLPSGYVYRATRYADLILRDAFPAHFRDLMHALEVYRINLHELQVGGGNRTPFVGRFDDSLCARGWGKRNIDIRTTIDGHVVASVRSHEIDMFKDGPTTPFPGIAVEMEWNNKDPFFDRDLSNFYTLHRSGALAVGVIVTRGPALQSQLKVAVRNLKEQQKYGESTTHWNKLMPRIDIGGGGECPLLLVGIEPDRINPANVVPVIAHGIENAEANFRNYKALGLSYREALEARNDAIKAALRLLPPVPAAAGDDVADE